MDASKRATTLAIAAAALFITGCANQGGAHSSGSGATVTANVKCFGANACRGQSECKTEMSACKGHNECKGQGFEMLSERACVEKLSGRA
jgi:hypothetical protein